MGTTLNKSAYQNLIDEDIKWLLDQPRTLEREHIEAVLSYSVGKLYPDGRNLTAEIESLTAELDKFKHTSKLEQLVLYEKKFKDEITSLTAELEKVKKERDIYKERPSKGDWQKLKAENKEQFAENHLMQTEIEKLKAENAGLKGSVEKWKRCDFVGCHKERTCGIPQKNGLYNGACDEHSHLAEEGQYDSIKDLKASLTESEKKVEGSIKLIVDYGGIDGSHHKDWVLDQVVRELSGDNYDKIIADAKSGEDGPNTYGWEEGIAP